ncbi:MAG: patatin-like phospholipase family protein [Lentisphaerae bacterium]|nr:patatin-like phospholipase family protein [Lentisphaerota bacterium]
MSTLRMSLFMAAVTLPVWLASADPVAGPATNAPAVVSRPKIGLVLGGGGALGMAHVGVLQVLEARHIPVDYIGGTSMGAIIAGLYASGMSADEIQKLLLSVDWWNVLKDQTPRREVYFRRKKDDGRYFGGIELGMHHGRIVGRRGTASGQKFNNLMSAATLRSAGIARFDDLPIPFRAVATDLQSGTAYVMDHGNLPLSMRASMAVPGVFTPVEIEGHTLVDGGIVNNLPVDVVRAMGADVIIAVDVGGSLAKAGAKQKYEGIGDILGRTYAIAQRPEQDRQLAKADVAIVPELIGFSAGQFHRAADIMPRGRTAAEGQAAQLERYAMDPEAYAAHRAAQYRPAANGLMISNIVVTGLSRVDPRVAAGRVGTQPGTPIELKHLNRDLMRLYALGEFDQVGFRYLAPPLGSNTLEYVVEEKAWGPNYLHMGMRLTSDLDQESSWNVLFNHRRTSLNRLGAEWDTDAELGSERSIKTEFYQPLDFQGILFVAPHGGYEVKNQGIYEGEQRVAEYQVRTWEGWLDGGVQLRRYAELRSGYVLRDVSAGLETGDADLPDYTATEAAWSTRLVLDTRDRTVFTTSGRIVELEAELGREGLGGDTGYDRLSARTLQAIPLGAGALHVSAIYGTDLDDGLPSHALFELGGETSFMGLSEGQLRGEKVAGGSLGVQHALGKLPPNLGRATYLIVRTDIGDTWMADEDPDWLIGAGAGLGADTILGPLYFGYGRAEGGRSSFYLSMGTFF